jgi:hypothetical protein
MLDDREGDAEENTGTCKTRSENGCKNFKERSLTNYTLYYLLLKLLKQRE